MASFNPATVLAATQVQPVDPIANYMRLATLQHTIQANKAGQIELRMHEREMEDDQRARDAMRGAFDENGNYSFDRFAQSYARSGGSQKALQAYQQGHAAAVEKLAQSRKVDLENIAQQDDLKRGLWATVNNAPSEQRPTLYKWAVEQGLQRGILKPNEMSTEYPGDAAMEALYTSNAVGSQLAKEAHELRQSNIAQQNANTQQAAQVETGRHNLVGEQETARHNLMGEGLTRRGQDLVNARAKEANKNMGMGGMSALPPEQQVLVKQIGEGKMAMSRVDYLLARNSALAGAVAQEYPDFDSSKVKSYTDAYRSFTSGADAKQLNAGAVAIQHLKQLKDINDANPTEVRIPGTAANKAFQNLLDTVADELVTFYGEPKTNEAMASKKRTLGGLTNRNAAILEQAQAMGVKFDELEQKWNNAAPSKAYQAPLPNVSRKAMQARVALDPEYANRIKGQGGEPAANGGAQPGYVRIQASDGSLHDIPQQNLRAAQQRDPGLKVVQ